MTREDVIDYFENIDKREIQILFLKRYAEHKGKEWKDAFLLQITPQLTRILDNCFDELFREFEINRVEDIATGQILKLV